MGSEMPVRSNLLTAVLMAFLVRPALADNAVPNVATAEKIGEIGSRLKLDVSYWRQSAHSTLRPRAKSGLCPSANSALEIKL